MNYYKYLVKRIGEIIAENDCEYVLYPCGERGMLVKSILNVIYSVDEKIIIDNFLCNTCTRIRNLQYLKQLEEAENWKILITSDNLDIYEEVREQLYAVVDKERCIEVFPIPFLIATQRAIPKAVKKMEEEGITREAQIYHPKETKSIFYLPLLPGDLIQREILLSDNYFEKIILDKVLKDYRNGIIGKEIAENKGVILDIGANIGNHTLCFCNEYNAQKVYCFEPVMETFLILENNIKLNHLEERVILNSFGLGEKDSRAMVCDYNLFNIGGTNLKQDEDGDLVIRRLDSLQIKERVILIKIDVEGMEVNVLSGGIELIMRDMPYIMVESFEKSFDKTKEILQGIGYAYEKTFSDNWLFYPSI